MSAMARTCSAGVGDKVAGKRVVCADRALNGGGGLSATDVELLDVLPLLVVVLLAGVHAVDIRYTVNIKHSESKDIGECCSCTDLS